jgi:uncharacterized protein (TIGR00661 family)
MRIFYAVQATGNGHISRALEILPYLKQYGEVDIFLSGTNAQLGQGLPIVYRSKGLSLDYNKKGGLDYWKIAKKMKPLMIVKDAAKLPLERYDLILNDFECVTSLACKLKRINSVHFGHQASFKSPLSPRPNKKDALGEWVLKNYCSGSINLGLHFKKYDENINTPIIKSAIINAKPSDRGYVTVYLPQYPSSEIATYLKSLTYIHFQVFTRETKTIKQLDNITFYPIDNEMFTQSLIDCHGIITGGGFETPAEALFMGKRVMVMPIHGQYEQWCNAAALQEWGVPVLDNLTTRTGVHIHRWYYGDAPAEKPTFNENAAIIRWMMEKAWNLIHNNDNQKSYMENAELLTTFKSMSRL